MTLYKILIVTSLSTVCTAQYLNSKEVKELKPDYMEFHPNAKVKVEKMSRIEMFNYKPQA